MLVSWYSAGISSLIATYLMRDKIDKVIYIDIDNQHEDSQRFVKDSEVLLGKEIEQLKSRYGSVENCIKTFKYVNGPAGARCTMMLKKRVRKEWEDSQTEPLEYVWGLDLDEKHRADRIVEAMPNNIHHFPLIDADLTKQDCHGMAFRLGIKRPVMYDLGYNNNNCFDGDEKFLVRNKGYFKFKDLIETRVEVLGSDGWKFADINKFGKQPMYSIKLKRNGFEKEIICTGNHRWEIPRYKNASQGIIEVTTLELKKGNMIPNGYNKLSNNGDIEGIKNGIIYGDGTLYQSNNIGKTFSKITLCNQKVELSQYFNKKPSKIKNTIHGLDANLKTIPSIDSPEDYKIGFIVGLIATDGCVSKSGVCISTTKKEDALKILELTKSIGLICKLKSEVRDTNYKKKSELFTLSMPKSCFVKENFLRTFHQKKFGSVFTKPKSWEVISVKPTGEVKQSYCATVINGKDDFTLENNILTKNCIGCVKGGMGYWNKIRIDFPDVFNKMALLEREVGGSCIKNCYLDELNVEQGRHTDLIVEDCGIFCELNLH